MFDRSIQNLIQALTRLPSVGQKTAERFVLFLLKRGKGEVANLVTALQQVAGSIKSCGVCQNFSESDPCHICSDQKRDHGLICVVEDIQKQVQLKKLVSTKARTTS